MRTMILALTPVNLGDATDWRNCVAAARAVAEPHGASVGAVLVGGTAEDAQAALMAGADKIWLLSDAALAEQIDPAQFAALFADALALPDLSGFRLALLPVGGVGDAIAASLATKLNAALLGFCTSVTLTETGVTAERPAYGGRACLQVTVNGPCLASMRVAETEQGAETGTVETLILNTDLPPAPPISRRDSGVQNASLDGAKIVVSGGRGIGGPEGFVQLADLAAVLGGALGGSLPSVDAGWVPVARQVGQSGKFVTPDVYVAVGISGTPQHMAGISLHTRIVAINKEQDADIFRFAEIGLVGEWQQVVPALIQILKAQS